MLFFPTRSVLISRLTARNETSISTNSENAMCFLLGDVVFVYFYDLVPGNNTWLSKYIRNGVSKTLTYIINYVTHLPPLFIDFWKVSVMSYLQNLSSCRYLNIIVKNKIHLSSNRAELTLTCARLPQVPSNSRVAKFISRIIIVGMMALVNLFEEIWICKLRLH